LDILTSSKISFIETSGARLAAYEDGTGSDSIVLLHGGPGVPDYLSDVASILAGRHRVIRFDQRGTGNSSCSSGSYVMEDYVNDLESIRRAFKIERLNLFGHSWGGTFAQLYASRYSDNVAKLCLCNSGIGLGNDWRVMERAVMTHNRRRGGLSGFLLLGLNQAVAMLPGAAGDRAARRMMARVWRNYFEPPDSAPAPSQEWLAGVHSQPIFATRSAALAANAGTLRGAGPDVEVLIMYGESDIYGDTTARLVARYPSARVVTIPSAGHVPWVQNRTSFAKELVSFFS
jgi:proline iminopeptidase